MKFAGARGITRSRVPLIAMLALAATLGLAGCDGDDGADGAQGPAGPAGPEGPAGPGTPLDPIASAKPESCVTCHGDGGTQHQDVYKDYLDAKSRSQYAISIEDVTGDAVAVNSVAGTAAGTWDLSLEFRLTKNGLPYNDGTVGSSTGALALLNQKRFTIQAYFEGDKYPFQGQASTTNPAENRPFTTGLGTITFLGDGKYTASAKGAKWDPNAQAGYQAYAYVAGGVLDTEGSDGSFILYADVADDGLAFGTANNYASTAVVAGCEACHGAPYLKHGYRAAKVAGLQDFAACKECHFDDRNGGHLDWQQMVDEPYEWATDVTPDPVRYAYKASVMQDTHQTHAMEFPYPMSMANCVTCHAGKLDQILVDTNFKPTTCKSCHPVNGTDGWEGQKYFQQAGDGGRLRAPAIKEMWAGAQVDLLHASLDLNDETVCQNCHTASGFASTFAEYHSGREAQIYAADGTRYADSVANQVSIDSVALDGNVLDVKLSAGNTAIVPELTISFYGYETKNMLVSSHTRDAGEASCYNDRAADPLTAPKVGCRFEIAIDGNPVTQLQTNRLFTVVAGSVPGAWHVQADLSKYVQPASTGLASIPDLIAAGTVTKAEVVVLPDLQINGVGIALNATTKTFDLVGKTFVPNYFQGQNAVVDATKCNACHDALGTTFHSAGYGGNVAVCRTCHVTTSGGAHLEMQSRGIDSYVHAIHKFQAFDVGGIDFDDPVEAARYGLHIEHTFPNFTIKNCEGCHVTAGACVAGTSGSSCPKYPVTYNVPDQSKSMPGLESKSATNATWDRSIGNVPSYVVGPANRACGGCHRAVLINEDDAGGLSAFNSHTDMGGYTIEDDSTAIPSFVYQMIERIMTYFD